MVRISNVKNLSKTTIPNKAINSHDYQIFVSMILKTKGRLDILNTQKNVKKDKIQHCKLHGFHNNTQLR